MFARSAVARLGVFMRSVGVGVASCPVITAGQSDAFAAKGGAVEAAEGTISPNTLEPKRLQALVQFRIEGTMTTMGLVRTKVKLALWRAALASSPARGSVQTPIMRAVPVVSGVGAEVRIDTHLPDTTAARDLRP